MFLRRARPVREADITTTCEPTVQTMWDPQHLTPLQVSTVGYGDSFTFTSLSAGKEERKDANSIPWGLISAYRSGCCTGSTQTLPERIHTEIYSYLVNCMKLPRKQEVCDKGTVSKVRYK
jgi:hypothetical protein